MMNEIVMCVRHLMVELTCNSDFNLVITNILNNTNTKLVNYLIIIFRKKHNDYSILVLIDI